jgi:hypothetical protein
VVSTKPTNAITPPQPNHLDSVRWEGDSSTFKAALDAYKISLAKHIADSTYNVTPFAVIPIKNYIVNADSVYIIFNDGANFNFVRKVAATDSLCLLIPNDFGNVLSYSLSNLTLQINAIKYSSAIISSKKYYFLRMASYIKYWKPI